MSTIATRARTMGTRAMAGNALAACLLVLAGAQGCAAEPTAAEVVEKHGKAIGGAEAWRKIDAMVWVGHVESAQAPAQFVLALKRPNKTRFEIRGGSQQAVRIFDGNRGWKVRSAQGKPSLTPYTPEEDKFAHDEQVIDGPLIDCEAKGITVVMEGTDEVDGHKAYRLGVTLPSGSSRREWIDAQTYLDIKSERQSRNAAGQAHLVTVYYRDYREVDGVRLPFVIESGEGMARAGERLVIDRIQMNPPLQDIMFAKPPSMRGSEEAARPTAAPPYGFRPAPMQ
ncbi:hypothetical protein [Cupriavidus metallidurans]|uniref:Outer membrane lipoprotein-sorting protein n=1 Tax=Cupriavidus metallidurans (strain ATCC 43123 / DSM 2839 / NBRC 102507 / CH34) TaxID=266264 RepID=Q1LE67_CUPMC|nr:hypothetical protein [Cupriavidus metallidurans]ABF11559.1 conserved hypothetical protein [Cupriavidus metallidurans CH34]QGS31393.1 hypothetical protein FOB83_20930 [Cupriavidus metallidurans]